MLDVSQPHRGRKLILIGLGALITLLVTVVAVTALAFPSVAATTCPNCYGLERLGAEVYGEPGLSAEQRRQVSSVVEAADRHIRDFYGDRQATPRVLVCLTDACYGRIGGGRERGIAVLNRAVMLSPRGVDPVIATHELSHVEFHHRLGSGAEEVPQWFDEGLAVVVSDDPRYLAPRPAADRCLVDSAESLPVTLAEWLRAASADQQTYAKAACRVSRWLADHGGRDGLLDMTRRIGAGEPFDAVVTTS
jgi:hypothetical protein